MRRPWCRVRFRRGTSSPHQSPRSPKGAIWQTRYPGTVNDRQFRGISQSYCHASGIHALPQRRTRRRQNCPPSPPRCPTRSSGDSSYSFSHFNATRTSPPWKRSRRSPNPRSYQPSPRRNLAAAETRKFKVTEKRSDVRTAGETYRP